MLTDRHIRGLEPQATRKKYFDGGGLYLEVDPGGGKWWRLKYYFQGKERRKSLGVYPAVSLKEAREKTRKLKEELAKGKDPSEFEKKAPAVLIFKTLAEEWVLKQAHLWTPGHEKKIRAFLSQKIYSALATTPVEQIQPQDVLKLCRTVESQTSPYMSHVIFSIISRVMRYGVACGFLPSDPCRDLRGALTPFKVDHMPAITDPLQVGILADRIDGYSGHYVTRSAMQFLLLSMCRTIEVRGARWDEMDLENAIWRIHAARMKMRKEHLVPLSRQALAILDSLKQLTGDFELVFPSFRSKSKMMSENTINAALRGLGYEKGEVVGHGFRSTASTLLNELGWSPDVIETQLAHASQGSVSAAYNRAAWLDDRRRMMQAWADYLDKLKEQAHQK